MKIIKYDTIKRGDKVIAYNKSAKRELYKGTIVRIAKSRDRIFLVRDDGKYSRRNPIVKNNRTWRAIMRDDGTWDARQNVSYSYDDGSDTDLCFDTVDNWKNFMEE